MPPRPAASSAAGRRGLADGAVAKPLAEEPEDAEPDADRGDAACLPEDREADADTDAEADKQHQCNVQRRRTSPQEYQADTDTEDGEEHQRQRAEEHEEAVRGGGIDGGAAPIAERRVAVPKLVDGRTPRTDGTDLFQPGRGHVPVRGRGRDRLDDRRRRRRRSVVTKRGQERLGDIFKTGSHDRPTVLGRLAAVDLQRL